MILKIQATLSLREDLPLTEPQMDEFKKRVRAAVRLAAMETFPRTQVPHIDTWPVEIRATREG